MQELRELSVLFFFFLFLFLVRGGKDHPSVTVSVSGSLSDEVSETIVDSVEDGGLS